MQDVIVVFIVIPIVPSDQCETGSEAAVFLLNQIENTYIQQSIYVCLLKIKCLSLMF